MKTVAIWLFMVFIISVYPEKRNFTLYGADKALHFMIYAITCALLFVVIKNQMKMRFWKALVLSVLIATLYGFLMEMVQGLMKVRRFSLQDALVNGLGALATAAFLVAKRLKGG